MSRLSLEVGVRLHGIGVCVIDSGPRELLYLSVGGLVLDFLREGQVRRASVLGGVSFESRASPAPLPLPPRTSPFGLTATVGEFPPGSRLGARVSACARGT